MIFFLLPISTTIRRRDHSIPREWFHLPEGAEPPSVQELLADDEEDDEEEGRPKSPPICGSRRSKSRDRSISSIRLQQQQQQQQHRYGKQSFLELRVETSSVLVGMHVVLVPSSGTTA